MTADEIKSLIMQEQQELRTFARSIKESSEEIGLDPNTQDLYLAIQAQIKILEKLLRQINK